MVLSAIVECMMSDIPVVTAAPIHSPAASRLALTAVPYTPLATSGLASNLWFNSTFHSLFLSSIYSLASVIYSFISVSSSVRAGMSGSDKSTRWE